MEGTFDDCVAAVVFVMAPRIFDEATADDVDAVTAVLAAADALGGVRGFLWSDGQAAYWQTQFYAELVAHAVRYCWVDWCADGVAVWLYRDPTVANPPGVAAACGPGMHRFGLLQSAMAATDPVTETYVYLALLAVVPGSRGQGIGSALVGNTLHALDEDRPGLPVHMVTVPGRAEGLLARHGFRPLPQWVTVPDGPWLRRMRRAPNGRVKPDPTSRSRHALSTDRVEAGDGFWPVAAPGAGQRHPTGRSKPCVVPGHLA